MRIGIVGMGFGAQVHAPVYAQLDGFTITGLSDAGSGRAGHVASQHAPMPRVFHNGLALARWDGIDVVSVAVPPAQQGEITRAALVAGKHVICEKPFGISGGEAEELAALAKQEGLCGAVCYEFRYDTMMRNLHQAIADDVIGKVQRIAVTWLTSGGTKPKNFPSWRDSAATGGGVLMDWCSHVIDYTTYFLSARISEVWVQGAAHDGVRRKNPNADENMMASNNCDMVCRFEDGTIGQFTVSNVCAAANGHRIEVYGDKGSIVSLHTPPYASANKSLVVRPIHGEARFLPIAEDDEVTSGDARALSFGRLARDFRSIVLGGPCPRILPTFESSKHVWAVLDAALHSSREGCSVRVTAI